MSSTTTLSSKFQISVPKEVREELGWKAGQKFVFVPKGGNSVTLVPVPEFKDLFGIAKGKEVGEYRDRNDRY
jgi:AbrB family looped-hinge helix DNA binding protein